MAASTSFVEKKFLVKGIWITTPNLFLEKLLQNTIDVIMHLEGVPFRWAKKIISNVIIISSCF